MRYILSAVLVLASLVIGPEQSHGATPRPSPCPTIEPMVTAHDPGGGPPGYAQQNATAWANADAHPGSVTPLNPNDPVVQQMINEGMHDAATMPGLNAPCAGMPIGGGIAQRLYAMGTRLRGMNTAWPGTECSGGNYAGNGPGNCACGAALGYVVAMALGNASFRSTGYYDVDYWRAMMAQQHIAGGYVPASLAAPGDIIVWGTPGTNHQHIGLCASPGCFTTMSNSSSHRQWAPVLESFTDGGSYAGFPTIVYHPTAIR